MKKILTVLSIFLLGTSFACADFLEGTVTRRPNRINPFVSQQMVKSPVKQKAEQKMHGYSIRPFVSQMPQETHKMRPGRNYDNPAADRFGDGSRANSYIWGQGSRHSAAP